MGEEFILPYLIPRHRRIHHLQSITTLIIALHIEVLGMLSQVSVIHLIFRVLQVIDSTIIESFLVYSYLSLWHLQIQAIVTSVVSHSQPKTTVSNWVIAK